MLDDIRELLAAEPFRTFAIAVTGCDNGYPVDHPRQVTIPYHGETVHYRDPHGDEFVIAVRSITTVAIRKGRHP